MPDVQRGRKANSGLSTATKSAIVIGVFVLIGAAFYVESHRSSNRSLEGKPNLKANATKTTAASKEKPLPRLVELGADRCVPCKMMAPILEELRREYAGSLKVESIDVWKNPNAAKRYDIRIIPTQIFYDASGREVFRHVGFLPKKDILGKWKELGIPIEKGRDSKENP
jgi:thioredoxin 1